MSIKPCINKECEEWEEGFKCDATWQKKGTCNDLEDINTECGNITNCRDWICNYAPKCCKGYIPEATKPSNKIKELLKLIENNKDEKIRLKTELIEEINKL